MDFKRISLLASTFLLLASTVYAAPGQWLHVRVQKTSEDAESVKVNVPISLVETVLPLIDADDFKRGKVRIESEELTVPEMREIWAALKSEGDFELATIRSSDTNVRISLEGNSLYIRSSEDSSEQVTVTVPGEVVDALLSGEGDELDVVAAVNALAASGANEIVSVQDGETTVRVWIDESSSSE